MKDIYTTLYRTYSDEMRITFCPPPFSSAFLLFILFSSEIFRISTKALGVLEDTQKKRLTPSPVPYSIALLAFQRMEDGHGALKYFVNIREKYQKGEIGKDDDDEDWENQFVRLENFTIRVCYQMMRHCLVNKDNLSTNVLKLLTEMDIAGVLPA